MQEVLVNRLGGVSLPRKGVVRLTYHPDMTLDVYRGRKTRTQQQQEALRWFGHVSRSSGLAKMTKQRTMKGKRRKGR